MDIQERLAEFFRRLLAAPAVANAEEALALVCRLIEELCPVPRQHPAPRHFTGRMYAPKEDRIQRFADGLIVATTRRHQIYCRPNGAITIARVLARGIVLDKKGKDERSS